MPTGYTADLLDGKIKTFPEFAKQCMRAFGATMHMRDENTNVEYTPRVPSDFYAKELQEAKNRYNHSIMAKDYEIISERKAELEKQITRNRERIATANKDRILLEEILEKCKNYNPPTKEHEGIKRFMIEQIDITIKNDCNTEYYVKGIIRDEKQLTELNANDIRKNNKEESQNDILYYTNALDEEIKRCDDSNKWVLDFLESIK